MKIAFLTPEYPHAATGSSGGIGTSIKNLAKSFLDQGHTVRILLYQQNHEREFDDNGVTVQCIKNVKIKGLSWYFTRKKIQGIINDLYHQKEIDIVEATDWTGITSFITPKKCPIVIRLNGSDTYFCHLDNRPVKWINKFHEKRALEKADAHISVSQYTASMTNQLFGLSKQFTIVPNSINCDDFNVNESQNTTPIILYFGTLIRKKGLLELPFIFNEVIKKTPSAQLYLVGKDSFDIISGNSSTWDMMKDLFSLEALVNVNYMGSVPYNEIKNHIIKASVCVFPTFAEALPVSWLEAMAMGKAVVASNIGWATEIIEDQKSGFLVDPKNHVLFADKIVNLLRDENLIKQIGLNARLQIENHFDASKIAKENIRFYHSIISKRR
jgi:glycosyltransferase involved in cell wall biosynthesis